MARITRTELYIEMVKLMAQRSTCHRLDVGCVIVKNGRIITTGYNSSPAGMPHCHDEGCLIEKPSLRCIRTVHAEAGAISFAARHGIPLEGTTLYVTASPCLDCSKLIINSGIISVRYLEQYRNTEGIKLLFQAGIQLIHLDDPIKTSMELNEE